MPPDVNPFSVRSVDDLDPDVAAMAEAIARVLASRSPFELLNPSRRRSIALACAVQAAAAVELARRAKPT
jgi:hypothetical protein